MYSMSVMDFRLLLGGGGSVIAVAEPSQPQWQHQVKHL
ncbi:hypothetical protein HMPREF9154_0129 [Arachnia propionica F0230a]|nr:hypothetical protein HMPREF9154_0129 [Arachnia propionica F0230a]